MNIFQGASRSVHLLWSYLLPEAEAYGVGQNARSCQGTTRSAYQAAYRGTIKGRWIKTGRDGARLSHRIWGKVKAIFCLDLHIQVSK